ncbi:hypothetical protein FO519_004840 [Halicephalobus sp. NKZ332]|nr:hypothetical protein FO519_004840 [Halicephalobus sp. NKZ332]
MGLYYSLLSFWFLFSAASGKYTHGILRTESKDWVYLDRFCFVSEVGKFQFELHYPQDYEIQNLYMYFDTEDQWHKAYNKSLSCQEKEDIANRNNSQILVLSPYTDILNGVVCEEYERQNKSWYRCFGSRSYFSMRPRWWYFAIGNCESQKGLYLEYALLMTNANVSNRWFYHFSFDEFYSFPITIFFMVAELVILIIALLFTCKYADDGVGFSSLLTCGLVFRQLATITFVFMLLLIAKGYTITRARLSSGGTIKLVVFTVSYIILLFGTIIWQITVFDPAEVTYISESLPAYLTLGLRIIAWLWFLRGAIITVRLYPMKLRFYIVLCTLMSLWFLAGPVTQLCANFLLDNWVRSEVVYGMDSGVMVYGFLIFLVLTCPLLSNRFFPYHVRTNQVSDCNFPQHVYEVQYTTNGVNEPNNYARTTVVNSDD